MVVQQWGSDEILLLFSAALNWKWWQGCPVLLLHILILLVPDCFAFVHYVFFTCFVYYMYLHCIPIVFLCMVFAKYLCCSQVEVVESDALSWCALCS